MTLIDGRYGDGRHEAHLARWFISAGCLGFLIAAAVEPLVWHNHIPTDLAFVLSPGWMFGLFFAPATIFICGGNFLLYGILGLFAGWLANLLRGASSHSSSTSHAKKTLPDDEAGRVGS